MQASRPSVPRDTRLLLAIVAISIATLWVLARVRFPDRVPTPNPVPPVFAQLMPLSPFEGITSAVAQLEPRLLPSLRPVQVESRSVWNPASASRSWFSGLQFRDDLALVVAGSPAQNDEAENSVVGLVEVGRDRAARLAVVRVPETDAPALDVWVPRRLSDPRFLIAVDTTNERVSLRPVFIGSLHETASPIWPAAIWEIPPATALGRGTFLFSIDGRFAGLTVAAGAATAIAPAAPVLELAERLARGTPARQGALGVEVQPLTPALAARTGAANGAVVTWVDPYGPAAGQLDVADVIERIDGVAVSNVEHWLSRAQRMREGDSTLLVVRRGGATRDVRLAAVAATTLPGKIALGLTLRTAHRAGAAIVQVDPDSAAARAGLQVGDILTLVDSISAPTAAQASRLFAAAARERPVLIGYTRGATHRVLALARTW
jgi:hypothetical protein